VRFLAEEKPGMPSLKRLERAITAAFKLGRTEATAKRAEAARRPRTSEAKPSTRPRGGRARCEVRRRRAEHRARRGAKPP